MITEENLNKKAFQESLLYFMREFVNNHNHALTYSIITDGVNWFIFDVNNVFKTLFAEDKKFLADYKAAQIDKSSLDTKTNEFYENIARPQIATVSDKIEYVHFNLSDMFTQKDTIKWNVVNKFYKIMAPVTLMKKRLVRILMN